MGKQWSKTVNLVTAIIDFAMALIMMMLAISGRSILAFVFGVIFVGMGVYFLRYFERQRRLENMTEEERIAFFKSGEAILVPGEVEKMMQEKHDQGK
ncbi:MAG: hypothetical protein U0N74_03145 [Peptococcaceae bacterium]|jgi:hypothetical protein|nr:hypothetical protein [Peptococcaceae bacterium]